MLWCMIIDFEYNEYAIKWIQWVCFWYYDDTYESQFATVNLNYEYNETDRMHVSAKN